MQQYSEVEVGLPLDRTAHMIGYPGDGYMHTGRERKALIPPQEACRCGYRQLQIASPPTTTCYSVAPGPMTSSKHLKHDITMTLSQHRQILRLTD